MVVDPRDTLGGSLAPFGAVVVVTSLVIGFGPGLSWGARLLGLVPPIIVCVIAAVWIRRVLRSRGRRVAERDDREGEAGSQ